ncbi:hypothetical protein HYDPIDRAFT_83129, partial [Hydnomerulius pinastri MD-312]
QDLRRELKVWARLDHTNIVPFLGITDGFGPLPGIVSPWFQNGSLSAYLKVHADPPTKLGLISDVAAGLKYLHSQLPAVIHGDLHPGNVLINDDGRACLADFGLSLVVQEFLDTSYLQSPVCGSMRYAAPELLISLEKSIPGSLIYPQEPADIYSFGCLVMEVMTGKEPFDGYKAFAVYSKICKGERPLLPQSCGISSECRAIIEQCWAVPEERPSAEKVVGLIAESVRA